MGYATTYNKTYRRGAYFKPPDGAGPWAPDSVSGLLHWADFSTVANLYQDSGRATPVTADGQPIGGVADRSSNAVHLSQGTAASRPLYKTGIINGRSVSRADGVDDYLQGTLSANPLTALSIYGAFRTGATVTGTHSPFSWAGTPTSGSPFVMMTLSGNLSVFVNAGYAFTPAVAANTLYKFGLRWTGTTWKFTLNGVDQTDAAGSNANAGISPTIYLHSGFNQTSDTDFGELFIYSSALAGASHTSALNYLTSRWG